VLLFVCLQSSTLSGYGVAAVHGVKAGSAFAEAAEKLK